MNLKKIIILSLLIWTLVSCSDNIDNNQNIPVSPQAVQEAKKDLWVISNLKTVSVAVFKNEIEKNDWILVDLRTPWEIAQGVIEWWAINIDFYSSNFKEEINKLDKNKKYLIYCRSWARSWKALNLMKELWFKNVLNLSWWIGSWANSAWEIVNFEEKIEQTNKIIEEKIITLNAKNWEFDKTEIRVKKGEKIKIKVNNLDWLHWIAIPDMQLLDNDMIEVDTSKTWTFTYQCLNYCWEGHSNMTWTLIIE
jgi:rhodanese-related sulfurtransferase